MLEALEDVHSMTGTRDVVDCQSLLALCIEELVFVCMPQKHNQLDLTTNTTVQFNS